MFIYQVLISTIKQFSAIILKILFFSVIMTKKYKCRCVIMIDMLNIYVSDDDVAFIEIVTAAITRILNNICGFQISTFDNGEDLLEECNNRCPDVVFLDIDMPFIDGFKVAEILQKHQINTLIVFVTSHEDKVYQSWTYQPFWFVRKSHLGDLEIVISKLLSKIIGS